MADDKDPITSGESSRRAFIQRMVAAGFAGRDWFIRLQRAAAASGPQHSSRTSTTRINRQV